MNPSWDETQDMDLQDYFMLIIISYTFQIHPIRPGCGG